MSNDSASGYTGSNGQGFYSQWMPNNQTRSNLLNSSEVMARSMGSKKSMKKLQNLQTYTFGGMTSINKTDINNSSEAAMESGREALTGFGASQAMSGSQGYATLQRPTKVKAPNFFEQAYGVDPIKLARQRVLTGKLGYMKRPSTVDKIRLIKYRGNTYSDDASSRISRVTKRSRKSKISQAPKQQDPDEFKRFNENMSVASKHTNYSRKSKSKLISYIKYKYIFMIIAQDKYRRGSQTYKQKAQSKYEY